MRTVRPKVPSRNDDTVYDKARVETTKGLDPAQVKSDSGSNKTVSKRAGGKPLPVAKPLEGPGSDKKSLSGANAAVKSDGSGVKAVARPVAKAAPAKGVSGPVPAVAKSQESELPMQQTVARSGPQRAIAKKRATRPHWPLIIGSVSAVVLVAIVALVAYLATR
jgi:hypothetical protein